MNKLGCVAFALLLGCAAGAQATAINVTNLPLFDAPRYRQVPVTLYRAEGANKPLPLVILSHGYGGRSTSLSFIAHDLVGRGFVVASIQHEIPGDPKMPTTGNIYEVRMPFWKSGAANILLTISELRALRIADRRPVVLIGGSQGGDSSMLFAREHPELTKAAISLDNRRMPLPRTKSPRICSLRSSDQPADPGVLPSPEEQKAFGILIRPAVDLIHNDMANKATESQKRQMLTLIHDCLEGV